MVHNILINLMVSFLVTAFGVGIFRYVSIKFGWLDVANERSSHVGSVPTGAGIVFVIVWAIAIYLDYLSDGRGGNVIFIVLAVALVGGVDDLFQLSPYIRIVLQFLSAFGVLVLLDGFAPIPLWGEVSLDNANVLGGLAVLGTVWMLNLYNFMDGADGFAAAEGIFVSIVGGLVLYHAGDEDLAIWLAYLGTCLCGFLLWNLEPAKVFMGDVGSYFTGFMLATVALISHNSGTTHLWFWVILFGAFIADATVTLVNRALQNLSLFQAHRTHAYQHLIRHWNSHNKAVVVLTLINILWLMPLALLSQKLASRALLITLIAYLPMILTAFAVGAGRPYREQPGALLRGP